MQETEDATQEKGEKFPLGWWYMEIKMVTTQQPAKNWRISELQDRCPQGHKADMLFYLMCFIIEIKKNERDIKDK